MSLSIWHYSSFPPVYLIFLELRRSIYGFLLREMPGAFDESKNAFTVSVNEWVIYGKESYERLAKKQAPILAWPKPPPKVSAIYI